MRSPGRTLPLVAVTSIFVVVVVVALAGAASDLRTDVRELLELIPRRRMSYIVARRYIVDPQFRTALNYLRGNDFSATWQQIRNTPEFTEIANYVANYDADKEVARVIDKIPNQLRQYQLPTKVPVELMLERDLTSFLREAVRAMPRTRTANLLSRKVREGGDFAKLYKALRRKEFRQLVDKARNSANLSTPLQELARNAVDVDEIIAISFSVLSWGP